MAMTPKVAVSAGATVLSNVSKSTIAYDKPNMEAVNQFHLKQNVYSLASAVAAYCGKDLPVKDVLLAFQQIAQGQDKGRWSLTGMESLYDFKIPLGWADWPGSATFLAGKLHLGTLMKPKGIGEEAVKALEFGGEHPGTCEEIAVAASAFNLINWQKDMIKKNMVNPENAIQDSTKDEQEKEGLITAFGLGWVSPSMVLAPRFGLVSAAEIKLAEIHNALAAGKKVFTDASRSHWRGADGGHMSTDGAKKPYVSVNISRSELIAIKDMLFTMITDWYNKSYPSAPAANAKGAMALLPYTILLEFLEIISAYAVVKAGMWDEYISIIGQGKDIGLEFAIDDAVNYDTYIHCKLQNAACDIWEGATDRWRHDEAVKEELDVITVWKGDIYSIASTMGFNHSPASAQKSDKTTLEEYLEEPVWNCTAPGGPVVQLLCAPGNSRKMSWDAMLRDIASYPNLKRVVLEGSYDVCKNQGALNAMVNIIEGKCVSVSGQGNATHALKFTAETMREAMDMLK